MSKKWTVVMPLFIFLALPVMAAAETAPAALGDIKDAGNTVCPVTGEAVSSDVSCVYAGKKYHFCCAGCVPAFEKNPEKYIKKMA